MHFLLQEQIQKEDMGYSCMAFTITQQRYSIVDWELVDPRSASLHFCFFFSDEAYFYHLG